MCTSPSGTAVAFLVLSSTDAGIAQRLGQWKKPANDYGGYASTHQTLRYKTGEAGGD